MVVISVYAKNRKIADQWRNRHWKIWNGLKVGAKTKIKTTKFWTYVQIGSTLPTLYPNMNKKKVLTCSLLSTKLWQDLTRYVRVRQALTEYSLVLKSYGEKWLSYAKNFRIMARVKKLWEEVAKLLKVRPWYGDIVKLHSNLQIQINFSWFE